MPFGQSSPIVVRGTVFLTGLDGDKLATLAYDARTGEEKWRRSVPRLRVDQIAPESGPAVPTPVADDAGVYSFFPSSVWSPTASTGASAGAVSFRRFAATTVSPARRSSSKACWCCCATRPTSRTCWASIPRAGKSSGAASAMRGPRAGRRRSCIGRGPRTPGSSTFGSYAVDAYDARTGEPAWNLPGFGTTPVASPVIEDDVAFVVVPDQAAEFTPPPLESFTKLDADGDQALDVKEIAPSDYATTFAWFDIDGDGKAALTEIARQLEVMNSKDFGLVAIDLGAPGGPRTLWKERKTLPYIATPILYRDVLFLVKDGGILTSYDPKTGAVLKRGRIEGATEQFFPSPVAAGGRLYLTSSTGTVAVVSAQAQWETLAVNDLDEPVFATPAVADGRLFVRTRSKLYAFAGK